MHRRNWWLAATVIMAGLGLAACTATGTTPRPTLTPVPVATHPSAPSRPIAEAIVKSVLVSIYPGNAFKASRGCGCTLKPDTEDELFPAGTPVVLLKITLTGIWGPSEGTATTQDVSDTTINKTKFEGRPELARLDTTDGPAAARALDLPWLPSGAFREAPWSIQNDKPTAFAAAWYIPKGVDTIDVTVDVPSEGEPTDIAVKLPDSALKLLGAGEE
ncbi:hypothetical protein HII28_13220 [Planctomonas sp. JC2975]|uniref:hypothetical protein n=1 Tax=Planctomonas sp. JC2975 TaxID=2729626 RepID=UPI001474543B|nr:hypothetical protein [Planctomonas sp. JC2975]NNC12835.1 hypothetical protein [Planctomonas sp. JC2975]